MPAAACTTSRLCGYMQHCTWHASAGTMSRQLAAAPLPIRADVGFSARATAPQRLPFALGPSSQCARPSCWRAPPRGRGSPLPHLRRDWAHPCHICAGTGLTPATFTLGLGSPVASAPSTALRFAWPRSGAMAERLFLLPAACARQLRSACARNCAPIRLLPHELIDSIE